MATSIDDLKELEAQLRDALEAAQDSGEAPEDFDFDAALRALDEIKRRIEEAENAPDSFDSDDAEELLNDLIDRIARWLPIPPALKRLIALIAKALGLLFAGAWDNAEWQIWMRFKRRVALIEGDHPPTQEELDKAANDSTTPGPSYDDIRRRMKLRWKLERLGLPNPDKDNEEVPLDPGNSFWGNPETLICGYPAATPFFARLTFEPRVSIGKDEPASVVFALADPLNAVADVAIRFDTGDVVFAEIQSQGVFNAIAPQLATAIDSIDYTAAFLGACRQIRFVRSSVQEKQSPARKTMNSGAEGAQGKGRR